MDLFLYVPRTDNSENFPNFQYCKSRLCSEGYISEGNTLICFILAAKQ